MTEAAIDTRTRVCIQLPLPIDVVATIGNLLDAAYPGTMIDVQNRGFLGHGDALTLVLPEGARGKRVSKKAAAELVEEEGEDPLDTFGFSQGEDGKLILSTSAPEALTRVILPLVQATFTEHPEGVNYVEQTVIEKEPPYRRFVVIACRSEKQTPHELRKAAEAKIQAALAVDPEDHATKSRDYGRGFAEAIRLVREALTD